MARKRFVVVGFLEFSTKRKIEKNCIEVRKFQDNCTKQVRINTKQIAKGLI